MLDSARSVDLPGSVVLELPSLLWSIRLRVSARPRESGRLLELSMMCGGVLKVRERLENPSGSYRPKGRRVDTDTVSIYSEMTHLSTVTILEVC